MSNSYIELVSFYEKDNINTSNHLFDPLQAPSFLLDLSEISKSKFSEPFHIYCTECNRVPVIKFISKNKVKLICECTESPKESSYEGCFKYLYHSDKIDIEEEKLKCFFHPEEKYAYYCQICKKNICFKCVNDCIEHKDEIKNLALDKNTIDKKKYIWELIKEKNKFYIDNVEFENDYDGNYSKYKLVYKNINPKDANDNQNNNINNDISINEGKLICQKIENNINTEEIKHEIINIMNDINNEELDTNEYFLINLLSIILDDSQNYPNINHIKTISNAEKFTTLYFNDYNEIKLKYEFYEENIKNNEIQLFGYLFCEHNRQKCFLVINEKIMELYSFINLADIFDIIPNIRPIILDVKLIERKNQLMDDLSFMFDSISTIKELNFDNNTSQNIKSMSHLFYNCSLIKELPDISSLNTINVTDMNSMFYNCSSLKSLPDISKWDTRNVTDMNSMFYNCSSLKRLPDISTWDTGNVTDMNSMFYNCSSLEFLPNISTWNIKKLNNFMYMFYNCKSLRNLSILSKWNLQNEHETSTIFKGCDSFEAILNSQRTCNFCDYFKNIFKNICCCFCNFLEFFCKYFVLTLILLLFIILLISPLVSLYLSFHSDTFEKQILETKEAFNLINYTNITHISYILNITNSSLIKEMTENKEDVIDSFLDEIKKEGNILLKPDKNKFKAYSIIIAITNILNILFFSFIILACYEKIEVTNKNRMLIIFFVIFISNIVSLIFEILEFFVLFSLENSIKNLNKELEYFFQIEIDIDYYSEINYLFYSFISISANVWLNIISIIMNLCSFDILVKSEKRNFYQEVLNKKN